MARVGCGKGGSGMGKSKEESGCGQAYQRKAKFRSAGVVTGGLPWHPMRVPGCTEAGT